MTDEPIKRSKSIMLQTLANDALLIQDACNLSGIVHSFSRAVSIMRNELHMDTEECNTHPVCILYANKIASLTGSECDNGFAPSNFARAYDWCKENSK